MIKDYFIFSIKSIKNRRIRSWLTMLGIFVGIAAVVALISLSQGMQNAITTQFKRVGSNRITITPGAFFAGATSSDFSVAKLTTDDLEVVRKVSGVDYAISVYTKTAMVKFRKQGKFLNIFGTPTDPTSRRAIDEIGLFDIEEGRQLKEGDKFKAVLGNRVAHDAFLREIEVGDKIELEDKTFEVVGIQKKIGTGIHDIIIRIPLETAREIFNEPDEISMLFVTAKDEKNVDATVQNIKKALRKYRNIKEGEEDFTVQAATKTIEQLNQILDVVQIVLVGIAAISLLVGGIGIMNTMFTSVLERTQEIGIMKAIGARNSDIFTIFLIESGVLGLVGGSIGVALGIFLGKLVEYYATTAGLGILKASFSWYLIAGTLAFSYVVGTLSGILPAIQASKQKPVDALRYE